MQKTSNIRRWRTLEAFLFTETWLWFYFACQRPFFVGKFYVNRFSGNHNRIEELQQQR